MDHKFPCCGMQSTFQRRQFNFRRRVALDSKFSARKGVEVQVLSPVLLSVEKQCDCVELMPK